MGSLKIFTKNIEESAKLQVLDMLNYEAFKEADIRIMPDVHSGKGCVIGFTAQLEEYIPNLVGVDIGCGMLTVNLGKNEIDLPALDDFITKNIPSGKNVYINRRPDFDLEQLHCFKELKNISRLNQSLGTLGGGNHFIEIDKNPDTGDFYLIIHSGSRNLGLQVATLYQQKAIQYQSDLHQIKVDYILHELPAEERESAIQQLKMEYIPDELCFLSPSDKILYLHDMKITQNFAEKNRFAILKEILSFLNLPIERFKEVDSFSEFKENTYFETVHNYISSKDGITRKGAISAEKGQLVLIPMNMRDGCLLATGLGNEDWNCSAPHGAGRTMSRTKAKEKLDLIKFEDMMKDVYSTSVSINTLDEAPDAYKPSEELINAINGETVTINTFCYPIYNFKA